MNNPANYTAYKAFFETMAEQHKLIEHFFYGYDEFGSALKSTSKPVKGWVMVLEPYENQGSEPRGDNYMGVRNGMLVLCRKQEGQLSKLRIEAEAEPIIQDLQSYLIDQYRRGVITIRFNQFSYSPIAPFFAAKYSGLMLDFAFEVPQLQVLKPENWNLP